MSWQPDTHADPASPAPAELTQTSEPAKQAPSSHPAGLGGWLILVAIGLIVSPIRILAFIVQTSVPPFRDGAWAILTTPGSEAYHALWAPLLIFELLGNVGFIVAQVSLLVLFFKRSRNFPRIYVWVVLINLPFILLDAWLGSFVITDEPMIDPTTAVELTRSVIGIAIWVPYMRLSKRVRNTFVA